MFFGPGRVLVERSLELNRFCPGRTHKVKALVEKGKELNVFLSRTRT